MSKYELYSRTVIPWLDTIPAHWNECRAKYLYKKENRPALETDEVVTCFRDGQVTLRKNRRTSGFTESIKEVGYQHIQQGDLVIHVMDAFAGAVGVSDSDGKGTPVYSVCTAIQDINNHYFVYVLREMAKNGFIQSLYRGIRERSSDFRFDVFAAQILPIPPREEQDQIVRYLDWQTSKINKLINAKKQMISLLNEKKQATITSIVTHGLEQDIERIDSGIDYIGQIPSHWKVLLNHRIYKEKSRKFVDDETVLSLSQKDGLLPYENMKERSLHTASYDNWKLVFPNDLVLNRFKAHLGVFFSSNYRGIVTFHYGVFEPVMEIVSKYYEALYHTAEFKRIFASKSNGMTVGLQNLSNANFYSVYTLYPPYEEQCQIVCRIEEVEEKYRKLICRINKEIECLHEYRVRLISDVVTGQIDVRRIEVPEFESVEETIENIDTEDGHETIEWGDMK